MTGSIAVFSTGLLKLRHEIGMLSGLEPRFKWIGPGDCEAIAGWGHKPTAVRARAAAKRGNLPYTAFEDGFLRSLKPGPSQRPSSMVMDRTGIYYDARQPSDLETMLQTADFSTDELTTARDLLALIATHRVSKYNHGADTFADPEIAAATQLVAVIDQTAGDESIAGALADATAFERMAEAATAENPHARVIARLHPETLNGTKPGYLLGAAKRLGLAVSTSHVSPWALFDLKPHIYTVSSQIGFEALLAGCKVTCFGTPFYAGWGLTDDRAPRLSRRTRTRLALELAAAVYLRYSHYFDAWFRDPVDAMTAIDQLAFLRRSYLANAAPVVGYRIARWKRRAVSTMLDGPSGPPLYLNDLGAAISAASQRHGTLAAWGISSVQARQAAGKRGVSCLSIEDGFLRSVGLGAAFVQPVSLVFDAGGLYFDPHAVTDIETLLNTADVSTEEQARAQSLQQRIVAGRITKYNVMPASAPPLNLPHGRKSVLVPGQVGDDWAVLLGRPATFPAAANVNAILLDRARQRHPQAFVIFKPHPDVEHLGRAGSLASDWLNTRADLVAREIPLETLLPIVGHVETYSSLAGFEALLRGLTVTVHGCPFYAGWGLTEDLSPNPRRGRKRTLDELVALALIRYPRYWDPVSGLVCPPEVALRRIAETRAAPRRSSGAMGLLMGRSVILGRRAIHALKGVRR
jgi:capsular polysaccharide export protein